MFTNSRPLSYEEGVDRNLCTLCKVHPFPASLPECHQVQYILLARAPLPFRSCDPLCGVLPRPERTGHTGSPHPGTWPRRLLGMGELTKEGCPRSRLPAVTLRGGPHTTTTRCWAL